MSKSRVLVVEDDERLRSVVAEWLLSDGVEVSCAAGGEAAVARVREQEVDVVVLDYKLPDIDGFAVLRQILRLRPHLPVVMLTGHASVDHAVEAMRLGAFHYLAKPAELSELSKLVRQAALASTARSAKALAPQPAEEPVSGDPMAPARGLLGDTPPIRQVREMIVRLGRSPNATVLITGESGTGKDVAARALHAASPRAGSPFTNVTCTALPPTLLESELFGHERGAFTDAKTRHRGLFERSEGGTVFLDEIGDMDLSLQAKLLHVLEQKRFRRVGGTEDLVADVRVVAATNVDLPAAVKAGRFRADLYYRLAVLVLPMPELRERRDDIELLSRFFVERFCEEAGRTLLDLPADVVRRLRLHDWPGNVRELRNVIERAVILASGEAIRPEDVQLVGAHGDSERCVTLPPGGVDMRTVERELLVQALERTGGNVTRAARLLGMNRDQVRYRVQKFGLREAVSPDELPTRN